MLNIQDFINILSLRLEQNLCFTGSHSGLHQTDQLQRVYSVRGNHCLDSDYLEFLSLPEQAPNVPIDKVRCCQGASN